jgi:dienelactone hydrolase
MHGPVSGLDFAAYVPFYVSCGTRFVEDEDLSRKPIRMFHGAADNYVPVAPCREYVQRLKAKGIDVALTEYPGAHHVFDGRLFKKPVIAEKSQSTRSCVLAERQNGVVVNVKTGQAFSYADPCRARPHDRVRRKRPRRSAEGGEGVLRRDAPLTLEPK